MRVDTPLTATGGSTRRVAWPIEHWPSADRAAWERARQPGDFLDADGAATDWRPASVRSALGAYGRWLAFLHDHAMLDPEHEPADRLTDTAIRAYIAVLRVCCASTTVATYLGVLGMMIQAMVPERDWAWLWRVQSRLQRQARPDRNKRARIVPVEELLRLGQDLMTRADADARSTTLATALAYRDGLMIALLALRPVRRTNFLTMALHRNLVAVHGGFLIIFSEAETKTRADLEISFPSELVPAMARYLAHHRPYLLGLAAMRGASRATGTTGTDRLWINQYGQPLSEKSTVKSIEGHLRARFGHDVNPHLFRDCAASSVASNDPEHVRIAAILLGHRSLRTTERHYILANARNAFATYHHLIASLRDGRTPPSAPIARKT